MVENITEELERLVSISEKEFKSYVDGTVDLIKQDLDFIKDQFRKGYSVKSKQEKEYIKKVMINSSVEKIINDYF